jgi:hypothetical protein
MAHPRQSPDGLLEVTFPGRQEPDLFVIEVATYPERRAEEQAVRDAAFAFLDRQVLPDVITLVLRPRGNLRVSGQWEVISRHGHTRLHGKWTVLELWTLSAEDLLAMGDVGVIPWVPLAQTTAAPEDLMRRCRERIEQQAPAAERQNFLAVTQVMARLRYNEPGLLAILGGKAMVIESPLIQELMEEREREVYHKATLAILQTRFGTIPADLSDRVRAIQDVSVLQSLHLAAAVSPDPDAFRAKLPA